MPPKPKFEKQEVIDAALQIARLQGMEAVTAREVASKLGTSTRPLFTYFNTMEELLSEVRAKAMTVFLEYLGSADDFVPTFKKRGMLMIQFAQTEPKLFQLLFMSEHEDMQFEDWMRMRETGFERDLQTICEDYHITSSEAEALFNQVWVYAYGICVLCATRICTFSEEQLAFMLGKAFVGGVMLIKSGGVEGINRLPAAIGTESALAMQGAFQMNT